MRMHGKQAPGFFATLLRSSSYEGQARDHKEKAFEAGAFLCALCDLLWLHPDDYLYSQ
jgi:hypothetical protein